MSLLFLILQWAVIVLMLIGDQSGGFGVFALFAILVLAVFQIHGMWRGEL